MKKLTAALVGASMAAGVASVQAEDVGSGFDISMNAASTSDYVWRGISQSGNHMAIQGGLDVAHETGFYAGTWGSSVDFESDANSEFDFYAGYGAEVGPVALDAGYIAYTYPDEGDLNFEEIYGSVSVVGVTFGVNSSGSVVGEDSTNYIYLDYGVELPGGVGLSAHIGEYDFKDATFTDSDGSTEDSYFDYSIGASYTYLGLDLGLTYSDTDLNDDECASFAGDGDYCDGIFALSVSKSM